MELPAEVCLLSNLTLLDLSFNSLRALPPQLALLVGLKTLRLAGNPLSDCVGSRDDSLADIYYGKGQAAAAGPSDSRAGYKRLMEHFKDNCLSREEQDELDVKVRKD